MNKAKINELYEQAYVTYEVPYESSVVDPTIVSVSKQKVWDRYLFAELLVKECADYVDSAISAGGVDGRSLKEHFGVEL